MLEYQQFSFVSMVVHNDNAGKIYNYTLVRFCHQCAHTGKLIAALNQCVVIRTEEQQQSM